MTRASIENLLDATRLAGLITTEGGRILAKVSSLDAKGTAYRSSLVELACAGVGEDRQILPLTRGSSSVGAVAAAEDGTTFFTAKRVGEDGEEAEDAQLWGLPMRGEAREQSPSAVMRPVHPGPRHSATADGPRSDAARKDTFT